MSVYRNNCTEHLAEAIQSVVSQSIKPNKVVLVKDGPLTGQIVLRSFQIQFSRMESEFKYSRLFIVPFNTKVI